MVGQDGSELFIQEAARGRDQGQALVRESVGIVGIRVELGRRNAMEAMRAGALLICRERLSDVSLCVEGRGGL